MSIQKILQRGHNSVALEQYKQVYETFRFHDAAFWQSLTVIAAVDIAGLALIFYHLPSEPLVRQVALTFPLLLTIAIARMLAKHRYFGELEQETLSALEDALAPRRVLRTSEAHQDSISLRGYWATRPCRAVARKKGQRIVKDIKADRFSSQRLMLFIARVFVGLVIAVWLYSLWLLLEAACPGLLPQLPDWVQATHALANS